MFNSLPASSDFCCLLLTFAKTRPDKTFDTLIVFLYELFEKANFEKKSTYDNESMKNYPAYKELSLEQNLKLSSNFNTH